MLFTAFDLGITHFDFANNYGPPPGSAEERVGQILNEDLRSHRDELIVSTKAGYGMWLGPYGDGGSRKYLLASLDASLLRLKLDYVDIFYHHRPDRTVPLDETLGALDHAVRSGKAMYAGLSNYRGAALAEVMCTCEQRRYVQPIIDQPTYNMFNRGMESDLLPVAERFGVGAIVYSPLAQGQLTDKYLGGIPAGSRAATGSAFLKPQHITSETLAKVRHLNELAQDRGQTLAQMALAWVLHHTTVTSVLIGASKPDQIRENALAADKCVFSEEELAKIAAILAGGTTPRA